jgi:hypothetical protein
MKKTAHRAGDKAIILRFALGGAIAALLSFTLAYWMNHQTVDVQREVQGRFEILALLLCPPSIGMMALDRASLGMQVIAAFFMSVENAVIYGFVGLAAFRFFGGR